MSVRPSSARPPSTRRRLGIAAAIVVAAAAGIAGTTVTMGALGGGAAPTYVPRDTALRDAGLYFYPAMPRTSQPRAFIFFFGNDVGFWRAHRQLAADLAAQGCAVVGFDMRAMLRSLPEETAARDSAFRARIGPLILRARLELASGSAPLPTILAGHSLGAEVALWTAAHASLPDIAGVLALSPGSRSHLRVSASDVLMTGEPTDPSSFAVDSVLASVTSGPGAARVAIIRGEHDKFTFADSALLAAGGPRARRFVVPLAGHSLKQVIVARFVVRQALAWVLDHDALRSRDGPPLVRHALRSFAPGPDRDLRLSGADARPPCECSVHSMPSAELFAGPPSPLVHAPTRRVRTHGTMAVSLAELPAPAALPPRRRGVA